MNKELIIFLGGLHSLGFAIFHLFFWRLFKWDTDLQKLTTVNKGIVEIANPAPALSQGLFVWDKALSK